METIRISDRKLKIMLTASDMSHFELNANTLETGIQSHRIFRHLLHELKDKVGFEADDGHISVQYFPSREGGCEMFISNLDEDGEHEEMGTAENKEMRKAALQIQRPCARSDCFRREFAYRFESLEDLLAVCRRLVQIGYICESSAWRDSEKRYFLLMTALTASPFSIPDEIGFIVEYGKIENAAAIRLYVREYGQTICEKEALMRLAKLS